MAVGLARLPRFLVLEPVSTVRIEIELEAPACEIDVELENPRPGRSFVLLIGHKEGPFVQRVRLAGRARILFDPEAPGVYVLLLANPQQEPLVLRLKARDLPKGVVAPVTGVPRPVLTDSAPRPEVREGHGRRKRRAIVGRSSRSRRRRRPLAKTDAGPEARRRAAASEKH
ncbi:MAG TPA: hypothetical protein VEH57_06650 [Thermoplasmata archaeon]|nr:hypothetical protein [Thermoplasmata archaeon]